MNKTRTAKYAYIRKSNSIGVILDKGEDESGYWYRTDSDGICELSEMLFLFTKEEVRNCRKQMKAHIAPSTKQLIGL